MPRKYLCRPRPRAFTPRAGSHKSHAIGAFAVRRYPPEAEYNTGGLARCSALEHTHLLPLALTKLCRADNFRARIPDPSHLPLRTATAAALALSLTLVPHLIRLALQDLQQRPSTLPDHSDSRLGYSVCTSIRPIHPSLYPASEAAPRRALVRNSHRSSAGSRHTHLRPPARTHARHDAGTAGLAQPKAQIDQDPQLLSSVRHPQSGASLKVYSAVDFCSQPS